MEIQNLRFISPKAAEMWALQNAYSGAPLKEVWYEPLFGPIQVHMTQQAYSAVEQYVYVQVKAGIDWDSLFVAQDVEPDFSQPLPLTLEQIEALIRLLEGPKSAP